MMLQPSQTIQEMIQKLQCGLHESEVWALCRECVLALQRTRHQLRKYYTMSYDVSRPLNGSTRK